METGLGTMVSAPMAWTGLSAAALGAVAVLVVAAIAAFSFFLFKLIKNSRALPLAQAERLKTEQLQQQSMKFDLALNSLSQGIVMFDAAERVLLWNQRYLEMGGLSEAFMRPGRTLREILEARKASGNFPFDIETYCREFRDKITRGNTQSISFESADGRCSHVIMVPMSGGGWITTHEDTTEQVSAKQVIEKQKRQLDAAVENMSQGLCMFDKDQRLIICNKQYAELYGLTEELTKPGTTLRQILQYCGPTICVPDEFEGYLAERLVTIETHPTYQIVNRLRDGRFISVVHRSMSDGGWVSTHEDITEAKQREESFRLLFEGSPMSMWVMDLQTLQFLAVNDAAITHYGYSRKQFLSMKVPDLRPVEDREHVTAFLRGLSSSDEQVRERTAQHRIADGRTIDVEIHSRMMTYEGRPARLVVINDITKAKRVSDELSRTRKFLDAVIEHVPLPIAVRDVRGSTADTRNAPFFLFNRAYEDLTGESREHLIGKTADEIYPPDRADLIVNADNEALNSDRAVDIHEHTIQTGRHGARLVTGKKRVIRDDDGKPQYLLTVLDDITERRRADERIAYLARNDSLTDLPNRATFVEYLDKILAAAAKTGEPFAILCVDLDRFKAANDVYGHLVGDALLQEAARRLRIAAEGQFVARVGGDEFTLILDNCPQPEAALALSEHLLAAFKPPFDANGQKLQLGLSIGGAIYPADGADATTLIANADAALYQAKAEARGSLRLFDAKLAVRLHERREMQMDLQDAVARGEFLLHYQPQEKLATGEITGFEALVRWQCPKRGLIAPGDFIPIAEETGLIVPLGNWILREACREAASWPQPLKIAVNISPIQFHAGDLAAQVHMILLETGLTPNRLELEITEGVLIDDFQRAISILRKLKSLGVQIAMDDFGSGYSSLSYLHSFAFDKIKIDRSFIGDLEHSHQAMAIVRAIISLGHSLNVPVLAEGVETKAQHKLLAQEGCDDVQGYLTGRPSPIEFYARLVGRVGYDARAVAGGEN
ncbi:MAG: EAL domain-containing protein [Pseudolabrys sp.]|nr:EAL domain-containing protein [Pseudolabrys sp.]